MTTSTTSTTGRTSTALLDRVDATEAIDAIRALPDAASLPMATTARDATRPRLRLAASRPAAGPGPARHLAPSRFDVHAVADFEAWVASSSIDGAGVPDLVLDCSRVDFIDAAAIESIERARSARCLELLDLSVAARVTFRLLDVDLGTTEFAELKEAA